MSTRIIPPPQLFILLVAALLVPSAGAISSGSMTTLDGHGPYFVDGAVPVDDVAILTRLVVPWQPAASTSAFGFSMVSLSLAEVHAAVADLPNVVTGVAACAAAVDAEAHTAPIGCAPLTHAGPCIGTRPPERPDQFCLRVDPLALPGLAPVPAGTVAIVLGVGNSEWSLLIDLAFRPVTVPGVLEPVVVRVHNEVGETPAVAMVVLKVVAGPLAAIVFDLLPDEVPAGEPMAPFTLTARDRFGNLKADYVGAFAFTSTDALAILPTPGRFDAADNGVRAFPAGSVYMRTQGEQTITSCGTDTDALNACRASGPIAVRPSAASCPRAALACANDPIDSEAADLAMDATVARSPARLTYERQTRAIGVERDLDGDGVADEPATTQEMPALPWIFSGEPTGDARVDLADGHMMRACVGRAMGAADPTAGLGRDLRCGGDIDEDGSPDLQEVNELRDPMRSGDDRLVPIAGSSGLAPTGPGTSPVIVPWGVF